MPDGLRRDSSVTADTARAYATSAVLADPRVRERITHGAWRVRGRLPTWEDASGHMERALSTAEDVTSARRSRGR